MIQMLKNISVGSIAHKVRRASWHPQAAHRTARPLSVVQLRELWYPANIVTLARLLLLPPTLRYLSHPDTRYQAFGCLALAMVTDMLDGSLARWRNEESNLGKMLDPLADKLLLNSVAIALSRRHGFPRWGVGLLLFRDLGIVIAALLVMRHREQVTSSLSMGKATTVALTVALLLYSIDGERSGKPALFVALVPFALSFWQYGRQFFAALTDTHTNESTARDSA
jgi:CDP-diacylglycerol--glycerol-3-phosphate 3-phosphatidyltransferase